MQFVWGESKRKSIPDFTLVLSLFDGRAAVAVISVRNEEVRFAMTGEIDQRIYTVIWIRRGSSNRRTPARRARDEDRECKAE